MVVDGSLVLGPSVLFNVVVVLKKERSLVLTLLVMKAARPMVQHLLTFVLVTPLLVSPTLGLLVLGMTAPSHVTVVSKPVKLPAAVVMVPLTTLPLYVVMLVLLLNVLVTLPSVSLTTGRLVNGVNVTLHAVLASKKDPLSAKVAMVKLILTLLAPYKVLLLLTVVLVTLTLVLPMNGTSVPFLTVLVLAVVGNKPELLLVKLLPVSPWKTIYVKKLALRLSLSKLVTLKLVLAYSGSLVTGLTAAALATVVSRLVKSLVVVLMVKLNPMKPVLSSMVESPLSSSHATLLLAVTSLTP